MKKRYPRYGCPGFIGEYLYLREQPRNMQDAERQLHALDEIAQHEPHKVNDFSPCFKLSRRRLRVSRTYWAFLRREQHENGYLHKS